MYSRKNLLSNLLANHSLAPITYSPNKNDLFYSFFQCIRRYYSHKRRVSSLEDSDELLDDLRTVGLHTPAGGSAWHTSARSSCKVEVKPSLQQNGTSFNENCDKLRVNRTTRNHQPSKRYEVSKKLSRVYPSSLDYFASQPAIESIHSDSCNHLANARTRAKKPSFSPIKDTTYARLAVAASIAHHSPISKGRRVENQQLRKPASCNRSNAFPLGQVHSTDSKALKEIFLPVRNEKGDERFDLFPLKQRQSRKNFETYFDAPPPPRRLRILDIDRLPLKDLHQYLLYSLVFHLPAEVVLKVVSRIGIFRDKSSHINYVNILNLTTPLFGPQIGPLAVALLCRAYQTISIPYALDYVRKFGQFSKDFVAKQVDKCESPRLFDFVRYQRYGGLRPLPGIITRPWSLASYTALMSNCSAKDFIYQQLKLHKQVPSLYGALPSRDVLHEGDETYDKNLSFLRFSERLLEPLENSKHVAETRQTDDSFSQLWYSKPLNPSIDHILPEDGEYQGIGSEIKRMDGSQIFNEIEESEEDLTDPMDSFDTSFDSETAIDSSKHEIEAHFQSLDMQFRRVVALPNNTFESTNGNHDSKTETALLDPSDFPVRLYVSEQQLAADKERKTAMWLNSRGSRLKEFIHRGKKYVIGQNGEWCRAGDEEASYNKKGKRRKHVLIRTRRLERRNEQKIQRMATSVV
ncbi:hypothetical protein IE077_002078 [Cardiosporidium cionae]|uniref:Uncharacterized protein n=1 Tax=Cardiosporidium cionae TaxID=476202 RepID=A0ABQ7JBN1_9APIC|nr:hypothetical protein IE077_002078 [Cardiosporidium cionae]|eukprot:KAF8821405.1 hypothetical protein IE077_002078 [Cardiosporidium cionae]